jgi:hypothetical protein
MHHTQNGVKSVSLGQSMNNIDHLYFPYSNYYVFILSGTVVFRSVQSRTFCNQEE